MIGYGSHEHMHGLFDGEDVSFNTRANNQVHDEVQLAERLCSPLEYFYGAVSRMSFEHAGSGLRERVLEDALLFVDAVERYAASTDDKSKALYVLAIGISKSLFFIIDPGAGPGADLPAKSLTYGDRCIELERALRERLSAYPSLWTAIKLPRAAHDPQMTWKDEPMSVERLASILFTTRCFAPLNLSMGTADLLAGTTKKTICAKLESLANPGSPALFDTMDHAYRLYGNDHNRARYWRFRNVFGSPSIAKRLAEWAGRGAPAAQL